MVLGTRGLPHPGAVHHVLLSQRAPLRRHSHLAQRPLQAGGHLPDEQSHRQREVHRLARLHRRRQHRLRLLRSLHRRQLHLAGPSLGRLHHPRRRHSAQMLRGVAALGAQDGARQRRPQRHQARPTLLPHLFRQRLPKPGLCRGIRHDDKHRQRLLGKVLRQPHPATLGRPRRHRTPLPLLRQGGHPAHRLPCAQQHRKDSRPPDVHRHDAVPRLEPRHAERPHHPAYPVCSSALQPRTHHAVLGF